MTDSVSLSEGLCQQMIHENFSQWLASTRAIRMCKTEYSFDPSTDPPRCKTENQLVFKKDQCQKTSYIKHFAVSGRADIFMIKLEGSTNKREN